MNLQRGFNFFRRRCEHLSGRGQAKRQRDKGDLKPASKGSPAKKGGKRRGLPPKAFEVEAVPILQKGE